MNDWKIHHPGESSLPRTMFPRLLQEFIDDLNKEHLVSGFRKCGIYPLDRSQIINRLQTEDDPMEANLSVDKCLIDILKSASEKRDTAPIRGKKISVVPGKDINFS